jgi:hypothetical protein
MNNRFSGCRHDARRGRRLVHHAVILEMNVESYRQRSAANRQKQRAPSDTKRDTKE